MTLDEKIQRTERLLADMIKFRHLSNETDEEFWKKVDYYLDYLIPLYRRRKK